MAKFSENVSETQPEFVKYRVKIYKNTGTISLPIATLTPIVTDRLTSRWPQVTPMPLVDLERPQNCYDHPGWPEPNRIASKPVSNRYKPENITDRQGNLLISAILVPPAAYRSQPRRISKTIIFNKKYIKMFKVFICTFCKAYYREPSIFKSLFQIFSSEKGAVFNLPTQKSAFSLCLAPQFLNFYLWLRDVCCQKLCFSALCKFVPKNRVAVHWPLSQYFSNVIKLYKCLNNK